MFLCCFRDNYSEKDDTTLPTVAMSNLEEKKKSAPANLYDWSSLEEMKKSECEVNPAMRYAGSRTKGNLSNSELGQIHLHPETRFFFIFVIF